MACSFDLRDRKVLIVGMGRTAVALAQLLRREGARPFVSEQNGSAKHQALCVELDAIGVAYECGGHTDAAFEGADLVIPSPGVSPQSDFVHRAIHGGAALMGEMEYAARHCHSKILAVTGTNGKTTTTELLKHILAYCGHTVVLAGNNELPLSAAVMLEPQPEYFVVEVSSYQLETTWLFQPWIGLVLNVTPDHLERHGNMEKYANTKAKLFARQAAGDIAVVNLDDKYVSQMYVPRNVNRWPFSFEKRLSYGLWMDGETIRNGDEPVASLSDNPLPGRHNLQNVVAALAMLEAGHFNREKVAAGLRTFRGVEHRLETVADINGVRYINDSKSTNIDSLCAALESMTQPVVLIAGGRGKGAGYTAARELVQEKVHHIVTLGEDAPRIESDLTPFVETISHVDTLQDAVRYAANCARPGDVVLLSPACASFDMFENFEERGRVFKEAVHTLAREVHR